MNFFFDVETTGLPRRGYNGYQDIQAFDSARLLSISWILVHNNKPIEQSYFLVRPESFEISEDSIKIHGITRKLAMEIGLSMETVLKMVWEAITRSRTLIAHNINFDISILLSEFYRAGMEDAIKCVNEKAHVCTMRKGKDFMGVKKFPKLSELYQYLFHEELSNAHDAQYDTLHCYKCYSKMFPQDENVFYFGKKEVHLTSEQKAVVYDQTNKNMLVIACAGSGKSSTMLCRIKHLINSGVNENAIIMMTFTRDAANDMREKLVSIMGYKPDIKIGTIDSIAKYYTENHVGDNNIDTLKHVSEYSHYFLNYLNRCGPKFFEQFKYIFVDEFQDINDIQYQIIKRFTDNNVKLFAVGDDAQNIYTFRGSSIEYILNFQAYFGESTILKLNVNFRSSPEIVNMANASIEKNITQIPKRMIPSRPAHKKPRIQYFSYAKLQNQYVVNLIESYLSDDVLEHNIAVLSPTNQTLYMIEEMLTKKGIKNVLLDGKSDVRTRIKQQHVCLSTIHKSKGLEWDVVILINMSDNVIPKLKTKKAEEEERRLFYVGITRAICDLHILYSASQHTGPYVTRYVAELDNTLYDFIDFKSEYVSGKSSNDVTVVEKSVTKLVSLLDGSDYVEMKKIGIIPNMQANKVTLFSACEYNSTIIQEEIYADFGIFVDSCITRILSKRFNKECKSKHALQTLACITLDNNDFSIYRLYSNNFRMNVKEAVENFRNQRASKVILERNAKTIASDHMDTITHILRKIQEHANMYGISPENIPVFNFRFLPADFESIIKKSHDTFSDLNVAFKECIDDIWEVSKCNRIVNEYRRRLLFKAIKGNSFIESYTQMFEDVERTFPNVVETLSKDESYADVFLHESYSIKEGIYGELDMRVGTTLIEFKTTINEDINMEWIIQLLCYKVLYDWQPNNNGKAITQVAVFNPLRGLFYTFDVSTWDKHKELVQFLLEKRENQ